MVEGVECSPLVLLCGEKGGEGAGVECMYVSNLIEAWNLEVKGVMSLQRRKSSERPAEVECISFP